MLHGWRVILSRKFGEIWHLVPIWERNYVICRRIQCLIRICVDFGFYPKLISHHLSYLIVPIGIGILPMSGLWIWHLLINFHVSLWCTISRKHSVSHCLLTTNLLSKIHWLINQPLILKPRLHWSLLKSHSLMILLKHLWKDKLPYPSIVNIHRCRPCRWLIIGHHHWIDIPWLCHKPLMRRQWIRRCVRHLEHWHLRIPGKRSCSGSCRILGILSHRLEVPKP